MFYKDLNKLLFDIKCDIKFIEKYMINSEKTNMKVESWLIESTVLELLDCINELYLLIEV